jgi:D-sedoheptulose 7-phosphate isomerase
MKQLIASVFTESIAAKRRFLQESGEALAAAIEEVVRSLRSGGKLLLFGDDGSAAAARHIAAEFVNRYLIERPPLPAIMLTTNVLRGIDICRELGIYTIGLTGGTGGAMAQRVDHLLCVSGTRSTPRIQEVRILIGHTICELVDQALSGETGGRS